MPIQKWWILVQVWFAAALTTAGVAGSDEEANKRRERRPGLKEAFY